MKLSSGCRGAAELLCGDDREGKPKHTPST